MSTVVLAVPRAAEAVKLVKLSAVLIVELLLVNGAVLLVNPSVVVLPLIVSPENVGLAVVLMF